jgi:hypothetical protein
LLALYEAVFLSQFLLTEPIDEHAPWRRLAVSAAGVRLDRAERFFVR